MRRYRAFISYSWADKSWAEWLHRALETYRTPSALIGRETPLGPAPKTLQPIFKDREEEAAGHSIGASIEAAMADSEFLVVVCSPRSAQSKWVNREVAWFKKNRDPKRILAVIVEGEPGASAIAGREAEECFPKTLLFKTDEALEPTTAEEDAPLAADARESGDGKRGAKLKIAAALLGVGLDLLVRRDDRRRQIRRRLVTAASLALATALGGLSIFAFNQRDKAVAAQAEAETQKDAALAAQGRATKARDDAEGLIELILTDLKSDLEGYGTLKSVTKIGDRAIGYYEGQDVKALTPDQLGRRARVLLMLGEADNKRGDLDKALARYRTAAATTSEQLRRDPHNPQRMFDHAQSVFWVGYIAWQRGDRASAKRQFTEYYRLATALVASDPEKEEWQAELDYAYSNLGTLAMDDGDAAAAEAWFRKSLAIALARLEKAPDDFDRIWAVGQARAWLADALHRQAKFAEAGEARRREIEVYHSLPSTNATVQAASAVAEYRLAQIEIALGRPEIAVEQAGSAMRYADALLAADPDRTERMDRAALARAAFGEANALLGRKAEAVHALDGAIDLGQRLAALDAANAVWSGFTLAQPSLIKAKLVANADRSLALGMLDTLISDLRPLVAKTNEPSITRVLCGSLAARSRLTGSQEDWREIAALVQSNATKQVPETQALYAEALYRTGDSAEATPILRRLRQSGYRHPDFMALLEEFPELKAAAESRAP